MCGSAASTPTPCRSTPIAAPGGPRPPTSSSASSTVPRASSGRSPKRSAGGTSSSPGRCPTRRRSAIAPTTPAISAATWKGPWSSPIGAASRSGSGRRARRASSGASGSPPTSNAPPGAKARTRRCGSRRTAPSPSSPARNRTGRAMRRPMRSSRPSTSTGGSRSIPVGGVSVGAASQDLARKLKELASDELEAAAADLEIADGAVRVVGTDRRIAFPELARLPDATEEARTGAASFVPPDATYPNGTHIAEVEIDPDTGVTALTRYTVCDDFGRAVNPLLLEGQVHGGVVQGIGQALHERTVYDAEGQLLTASFMDYALPRAEDVPFLRFETRNVPSTTNPLGIKGAGEAGSIGSCPAVMNAVVDALDRGHGLRDIDMPATPHAIRKALATR